MEWDKRFDKFVSLWNKLTIHILEKNLQILQLDIRVWFCFFRKVAQFYLINSKFWEACRGGTRPHTTLRLPSLSSKVPRHFPSPSEALPPPPTKNWLRVNRLFNVTNKLINKHFCINCFTNGSLDISISNMRIGDLHLYKVSPAFKEEPSKQQ